MADRIYLKGRSGHIAHTAMLAVMILLVMATVVFAPAARADEKYVYSITDVQVTDDAKAVRDGWTGLPGYTGVTRHHVTVPYVPHGSGKCGTRYTAYDVNTRIRGSTTTIWVKYEYLPTTSKKPVLVDIAVTEWHNFWTYAPPAGFERARGTSRRVMGGLTTGKNNKATNKGLIVKYKPLNEVIENKSPWVLGLHLHCIPWNIPWPSPVTEIKGINIQAERAGTNIHKGAGGSYYFLMKLCGPKSPPVPKKVWITLYNAQLSPNAHVKFFVQYEKHGKAVTERYQPSYTSWPPGVTVSLPDYTRSVLLNVQWKYYDAVLGKWNRLMRERVPVPCTIRVSGWPLHIRFRYPDGRAPSL